MGFLSNLAQAVVKTVALPVAITKDVVTQGKLNETKELIEDIEDDVYEAFFGN